MPSVWLPAHPRQDDEALTRLLLQRTHHAHPGVPFDEGAAESLVDDSATTTRSTPRRACSAALRTVPPPGAALDGLTPPRWLWG